MKNKNGYKRAFTLTELLVVVVVIGVLATLTLPKFSKVLETRKTTEAENILRAVRTEQERRCALDKNYLGDLNKMPDLVPNTTTANYTYAALTGGIRAQSNGSLSYQLQMPSYADGRICCTGTDCSQLNKDYPTCDELRAKPDYVASPSECAADVGETPDPAQCGPQPADETQTCLESEGLCGTLTRSYHCDQTTGQWVPGAWKGQCQHLPDPVTYPVTAACDDGQTGVKTRECTRRVDCNGNTHEDCGAWNEEGCETEYEWHWFVGGGILSQQNIMPPQSDDCDWGDAWFHNSWPISLSWNCEHCNRIIGECNEQTGIHMVRYWHCYHNQYLWGAVGGVARRVCSLAICLPHKPGEMPLGVEFARMAPKTYAETCNGTPSWWDQTYGTPSPSVTVLVEDQDNPYGLLHYCGSGQEGGYNPRNVNCHED